MAQILRATTAGDAYAYTNNNAFYGTNTELYLGNASSGDYPCRVCMPFPTITIPQGTIITSATLRVYGHSNQSGGTMNYYVGCEAVDNATTPTNGSLLNGKTMTSARVTVSSSAGWSAGVLYTFDLTTAVQEVISRGGFASGNQINVLIHDNGSTLNYTRAISSYENAGTYIPPYLDIVYPLPSYTVTFNANGGSGSMTPQTTNTPTALTTNSFTRTGYTFGSWNTIAGGGGTSYSNGGTYQFTVSDTLYAQWTAVSQTLTFNSNGGSAVSPIVQNYDTTVYAPTPPTKTGYSFVAWYSDAGLTTEYTFPHTMGLSTTIYAKWTAVSQTLTFNSNGGSAVSPIVQNYDTTVYAPTPPTRGGYAFVAWYSDAGLTTEYTFPHTMGLSTTVYAKWNATFIPQITNII